MDAAEREAVLENGADVNLGEVVVAPWQGGLTIAVWSAEARDRRSIA